MPNPPAKLLLTIPLLAAAVWAAGEVVLERHVSEEQAAADLAAIRGMWELAAVYEFMGQFKFWLNFSQLYPLQDLEEALVRAPGPGGEPAGWRSSKAS